MFIVNKSQVELIGPTELFGEASTMGLPVGQWPDFISVVDDKKEGFLFHHARVEGEIHVYLGSTSGIRLNVLND